MNERELFMAAVQIEDPGQRSGFLDRACGGEAGRRQRVEALLKAFAQAGSFLQQPAADPRLTADVLPASGEANKSVLDFLSPSDKPGSLGRLGHYEIQEVVGTGGMGVVFRAFDEKLHRVAAIKVMAAQLAANATARKRFSREAQAAAAVSHDHIVTIHAVEEANGVPYLVMQYVAGMSLQERLDRDGPLELHELLRIGMQTASALAAAHAQGLIHRDIKPANILLENGVERVKITDFGLARAAADASLTQSGVVAGTPQYMAPEQASGEPVDARTDLFSLGSVLYAMCTARAPFRASGTMAVLKRVCEQMPSPIRDTNPEIPDWLVAIIDKLHAKDPAQRYQSAAEVAELLGRHLARVQHPSVAPLPVGMEVVGMAGAESSKPPPHRRRWAIAAAIILPLIAAISLTEATGVTTLTATVIRVLTPEGTLIVEVDDPNVKVTIEGDGGIVITGAGPQEVRLKPGSYRVQATKDGKPARVDRELVTITRSGKQSVKVSLQPAAAAAATGPKEPLAPGEVRRFVGHTAGITSIALSRDGSKVLSGSRDKTLRLWNVATGKEIRRFEGHTDKVSQVALSPDGRHAMSTADWRDPGVRRWDVATGKELPSFQAHEEWYSSVAFSPDGRHILAGAADGRDRLTLCDAESGKELRCFKGHTVIVFSVAFSPDGRRVLSGSGDKTMRLFDVETGQELRRYQHDGAVVGLCFFPDGRRALCGGWGIPLQIWDLETGKVLRRFEGSAGSRGVAISRDGRFALSGENMVRLWDVATGELIHHFRGHTNTVTAVAFTPDGRFALSAGWEGDNTLRLWELPKQVKKAEEPKAEPNAFVLLGGKGIEVRKFDTLAEAVHGASDGDTIEIRGNGPFLTHPIKIGNRACIRAGEGYRPVIKLSAEGAQTYEPILQTAGPLILEGLEFQRLGQKPWAPGTPAIFTVSTVGSSLHVANCRFRSNLPDPNQPHNHICINANTAVCHVRNCAFLCPTELSVDANCKTFILDNCLHLGRLALAVNYPDRVSSAAEYRLSRNTLVSKDAQALYVRYHVPSEGLKQNRPAGPFKVEAMGNILDVAILLYFSDSLKPKPLKPREAELLFTRILAWNGRENLYQARDHFVVWDFAAEIQPSLGPRNLAGWKKFWGAAETSSIEGAVRYLGGDLLARLAAAPDKISPEDFRLRPDSAGYRAGKDGKDLGADIELVGPGKAYERWKKTPEYQKWLKDTGQK